MKKIGILIVVYNSKNKILKWLENYKRKFSRDLSLYLLVLDNNSTDGTFEAVRKDHPDIDIRKLKDNYGCTTARNVGIIELVENIGCEIYASFDDDVIIEDEEFFIKIRKALDEHPEIDGYCGVLRWADDKSICSMGSRKVLPGLYKTVKKISDNRKVDYVPGGACIIRASTFIKYGLYDNDFPPIGVEDKEWGIRVSQQGANLHYYPQIELFHYHDRKQHDSMQKRGFVIQAVTIELRKYFSIPMLLMRLYNFRALIKPYGIKFAIQNIRKSMVKKLNPRNYYYEEFKKDYNKYYA